MQLYSYGDAIFKLPTNTACGDDQINA